jgi:polar amino acid transport system permease protein/polar amino acid transport system substrate-binding protein
VRRLVPLLLVAATAHADRLQQIRASGELRWGGDAQGGAPYVFQDPMDPNHLIGFEVDFVDALAQKLGLRARPVQGQWEELLELVKRGDFDVAVNGIEVAEEKKRVCQLSRPYYAAAEKLTIRKNDATAPKSLEALRGRKVGTLPGSLAERILQRAGAEVKTYNGGQGEIYDDLRLQRLDAVLLDEPITRFYGEIERELQVVDGAFGGVQYAVAVPQGEEELLALVDRAIGELAREGKLRAIYEKWGLWNAETATLFHDDPAPRVKIAEAWEAWRAAVGKSPTFWERVRDRYPRMQPMFARGAALTLALSLSSMALAICLGVMLALGRTFGPRPVRWICSIYVEFVRGTPLLVQLIMIYFGLPELGVKLEPFTAGWLALGLNYAAAEAENYRAGLLSVPAAQREAAWSLGLGKWQTIRWVVAPQAIRVSLPPVTNDFIALLKDSSLVALVTMVELDKTYMNLASSTRDHLGLGVVVALWYLLLGLPFARLARWTEERMSRKLRQAK